MTDRTFNTEITYNRNCKYQQSKSTQEINVPLTQINLDISFTNVSQPTQSNIYFNDVMQVTVFASQIINNEQKIIQWGNVIFYYVDANDLSMTKQEINHVPMSIDKNGNASIKFIPHNSGTIYVKYFGEPYHTTENEYVFNNFVLHSRPTHIQFEKYSPYLIDPNETVTMNVEVTDANTNDFIDYGLVTFMNYHEYVENRVEKIIGNPRYLTDGKANIHYSPIQLNTNDLFHNIELIRASYNYNNEQYGETWKYYSMSDDFTAIAIRRENQININIPQTIKNDETYQALTVADDGAFTAIETNQIICQCEITMGINETINNAIVHFVVEGVAKRYTENEVIEEDIIEVHQAYYRNTSERNYFECLIEHLPQGTYTIYATVENPTTQIDNKEYVLPIIDNQLDTPDVPITNSGLLIKDGIYLQSNKSESFYLKIEPQTNPLTLELTNNKPVVTNKIINKDDIKLEIKTTDETDIIFLKNKNCYFYIPSTNTRIQGTIIENNNKLYAKPSSDISITNVGNYDMYAYFKEQICKRVNNNTITTRKYNTTYSNNIEIKVRDQIDITLELQTIQTSYPHNIKYIIEGKNLSDDPIEVQIWIDNQNTTITHILSKTIKNVVDTIPLQAPGEHTIKAIVNNANYNNIYKEKTFIVTKGKLDITLMNDQPILTSTTNDLFFNIKHKNNSILTNIEDLTFNIEVIEENNSSIWNVQSLTRINDKTYQLNTNGCLYIDGDWQVNINCSENDYYDIVNQTINFKTSNITPMCVNIEKNIHNFTNKVIYDQNTQYIKQIINEEEIYNPITTYSTLQRKILVISKLIKDENNHLTFVHITDIDGNYTITQPQSISNTEWQAYKKIEYHIAPQHTLLNAFKNLNNNDQIITTFNNTFSNHQCSNEDIINLYNNAKEYNFKTLFVGYNDITDIINLYEEVE